MVRSRVNLLVLLVTLCAGLSLCQLMAQTIDLERQSIGRYAQRMYENTSFEGIQLVDANGGQYIIAILSLDEKDYRSRSTMNRVATVKANSMISKYFNGSNVVSSSIVHLEYDSDSLVVNSTIEDSIREVSMGQVKAVELFSASQYNNLSVYVFGRKICP